MGDLLRTNLTAMDADTVKPYPELRQLAKAMTRVAQYQRGEVAGTGVNIDVTVDGTPQLIILLNETQQSVTFWTADMAAASMMDIQTQANYTAADGITGGTNTFRIGTDAAINQNLDVINWFCIL